MVVVIPIGMQPGNLAHITPHRDDFGMLFFKVVMNQIGPKGCDCVASGQNDVQVIEYVALIITPFV